MSIEGGPQHTPPTADIASPQQGISETPSIQEPQKVTRRKAIERGAQAIGAGIALSPEWTSPQITSLDMNNTPSASDNPGSEHGGHRGNNKLPKVKNDK